MIQVENLTKYYGEYAAIENVSFAVEKGEILGFLGPNAAGKTTTMRILTGFLQPTGGRATVAGHDVVTQSLEARKRIGYLPENVPLYDDMTPRAYLRFAARLKGVESNRVNKRVDEVMDATRITDHADVLISKLSKGYRQRVGIAQALIHNPEVLVLDEPTVGLDPNQIVEIRDIIRSIGRDKTIILSTHILSEAEATCDRIVIIDRGRIVADGSTEMLTMGTGQEKTIHLTFKGADSARARDLLSGMAGVTCVEEVPSGTPDELRMTLLAAGESDLREEIYRAVRATDWILLELRQEGKSLEKIFRELTREE